MPYRRRIRKRPYRRRPRKPRPWLTARNVGSAFSYAMAAYRGVKYLKGLVNAEMKDYGDTGNSGTFTTTPTITHLTAIAQGDGPTNRDGNSIFVRFVGIRMRCSHDATNSSQFNRIVVVRDKQQVADGTPTWTDVFESADENSYLKDASKGRFDILYDCRFCFANNDKTARMFDIKIPMKHHVRFNDTAATDIQKGGIYLMLYGSNAANGTGYTWDSTVKFHDN